MLDTIVLGAGPAGLSAALWLGELGLRSVILERRGDIGGELPRINLPVDNYLGISGATGPELLAAVRSQAERANVAVEFDRRIERVDAPERAVLVGGELLRARTLIVATGLRRRLLEQPDVAELVGRGVTYSPTTDISQLTGLPVAIVGGGDGAIDNALILADSCPQVHVLCRRERLRARRDLLERAEEHPRITIHRQTRVIAVSAAKDRLDRVSLEDPAGKSDLAVAWLAVKIGFAPNTELLAGGPVELDESGYVVVDRYLRTSCSGVFAAGDVCNPRSPCLAAAAGDGALAAREAARLIGRFDER